MSKANKIVSTDEAWEDGTLGNDAAYAAVAPKEIRQAVEDALAMQPISIRLPKSVIDDFKAIASIEGIGYQPLMREALTRFAECEAKRIMHDLASKRAKEAAAEKKAA